MMKKEILKKLICLVILLVLNCLNSWCQNNTYPTGGQIDSVFISIDYIRLANQKLIEGISCKKVVIIQDSIINLQQQKYAELEIEAGVLQTKLYNTNKSVVKLKETVDKQKRKVRFLGGTALVSTLAFLLCVILK